LASARVRDKRPPMEGVIYLDLHPNVLPPL